MKNLNKKKGLNALFHNFATVAAKIVGRSWAFIAAVVLIIGWGLLGPLFNYSDTWQLFINTTTTIITFLMVFLIQHTQNRDADSIHLKLDELIRSNKAARNTIIDLDNLSDEQLEKLKEKYIELSLKKKK